MKFRMEVIFFSTITVVSGYFKNQCITCFMAGSSTVFNVIFTLHKPKSMGKMHGSGKWGNDTFTEYYL